MSVQIPLSFSLDFLDITPSWSMLALILAFLKIIVMIVLEFKTLVPVITQLCKPPPEIIKLARDKDEDASLSGYLLEQMGDGKREQVAQAFSVIDDNVVATVEDAVNSLESCFVAYRRERRDVTQSWLDAKETAGGLVELASNAQQLDKIIPPVHAFKLKATDAATQVRAPSNHSFVRGRLHTCQL